MAQPIESAVTTRVVAARRFGNALVEVALGDVTAQEGFEAFAHPTNSRMALDGKVGAGIRAKADEAALAAACLKLAPLQKCSAALTPVFGLGSPNVIHCRGPRRGESGAANGLRATYRNVLELAEESGFKSVAIPAVSTGSNGFSAKQSGDLAMEAVRDMSPAYSSLKTIRFVLSDRESVSSFSEALTAPHQVSDSRIRIELPNEYSVTDFRALRRGNFGHQDSKWFLYHEEPWLLIYRGNREFGSGLSFSMHLPDERADSERIREAWAEEWILDELGWGQEMAGEFVSKLLDDTFGLLRPAEDRVAVSGVTIWVAHGKVVFGCRQGEMALSPREAERLGLRLVEMSRKLGKTEGS